MKALLYSYSCPILHFEVPARLHTVHTHKPLYTVAMIMRRWDHIELPTAPKKACSLVFGRILLLRPPTAYTYTYQIQLIPGTQEPGSISPLERDGHG